MVVLCMVVMGERMGSEGVSGIDGAGEGCGVCVLEGNGWDYGIGIVRRMDWDKRIVIEK